MKPALFPIVTAPSAFAAPCPAGTIADPVTGVCWSQSQGSIGITGTGGVCLPGRLGLCLGALPRTRRCRGQSAGEYYGGTKPDLLAVIRPVQALTGSATFSPDGHQDPSES